MLTWVSARSSTRSASTARRRSITLGGRPAEPAPAVAPSALTLPPLSGAGSSSVTAVSAERRSGAASASRAKWGLASKKSAADVHSVPVTGAAPARQQGGFKGSQTPKHATAAAVLHAARRTPRRRRPWQPGSPVPAVAWPSTRRSSHHPLVDRATNISAGKGHEETHEETQNICKG